MRTGNIFDVKQYALHDGPGIRTTVFLKGCPLCCQWCHNPEGIVASSQILYRKNRCIGCGECLLACPEDALLLTPEGVITNSSLCKSEGACADVPLSGCSQRFSAPDSIASTAAKAASEFLSIRKSMNRSKSSFDSSVHLSTIYILALALPLKVSKWAFMSL